MLIQLLIVSVTSCGIMRCAAESGVIAQNETRRTFINNVYNYDTLIKVTLNSTTEQILDFTEESEQWHAFPTRVHASTTDDVDDDHPVFITATQQKGVSSWELPLVVEAPGWRSRSTNMARTLCPHDAGPNITTMNRPTLQMTTSSDLNVTVAIKLRRVRDFFVQVDKEVHLNATPSTPKYYYFSFDNDPPAKGFKLPTFNYTIPKSVILVVESEDERCAVVSIQNNSCPIFDNEQDVKYQGYHLTMMSKGGITLTQSMFPVGFYIVFIVKQDDEDCMGRSETPVRDAGLWEAERVKNFRFRVIATISYAEYAVAALVMLALLLLLLALAAVVSCLPLRCSESVVIVEEGPGPSAPRAAPSDVTPLYHEHLPRTESLSSSDSRDSPPRELELARPLTVAGLSRRPAAHSRRSDRYFWSALTVAVVYALPVVQLLLTYQRMVFSTGDQDLCYYNFLCAHPLGSLSDFNHVLSNAGYVLLGAAFMVQVRVRQLRQTGTKEGLGIPPHHGIFYSMGLALSMEGILSACYHLCPNKMNFQFDSSFMYVIAVLVMIKLYQNRHPDVNASAHSTFMLLAVVMTIGVFGIMYPSIYFWVLFTALHLGTCAVLTMKIYYVGQFKMDRAAAARALAALRARAGGLAGLLRPRLGARAALLAVANAANWALAAYGLYEHNKDLARHLLAVLMGNAVIYLLAYVVLKLVHKEKVPIRTWVFGALAHAAWGLGLYLFLNGNTRWADTAAGSRRRNAQCTSLQFFDRHDLWHGASAAAIFLSFNALLTVDDALALTPRGLIPVF